MLLVSLNLFSFFSYQGDRKTASYLMNLSQDRKVSFTCSSIITVVIYHIKGPAENWALLGQVLPLPKELTHLNKYERNSVGKGIQYANSMNNAMAADVMLVPGFVFLYCFVFLKSFWWGLL